MEGDVDTVGLAASTDDLPLGRDVAGPVLVLTLKLAPNHTAPTMRNVEVPLLATTPTGVEVPVTLVLPLAASVMCSTDFTVPLVMV
jgi:hypothetical protein